jgi:hypothetical protein
VPRIKRKPAPFKKHLEPSAEIHWCGVRRNSDIAEVAGAVSRRDVHAAAQRDREMREVAAYTDPFTISIECGTIIPCVGVSKFDVVVNEVADGLYPIPSTFRPPDLMDFSMTPNRRLSAVWCQETEFRWC